jgi:acyl-CoA synthetase (AMP-forming)/AMP-acid ligase II
MFILDRKKDMIVSGGFNIFPREVEDVLSPAKVRSRMRTS